MKVLRTLTNVLLLTLMGFALSAQTADRTLVKSFNLKGHDAVVLDLKGDVDVQHWPKELVRIQISIQLENGTESILKSLILTGRYNLKDSITEDGFLIQAPGLLKGVKLKDKVLKEQLSYIVFAPDNVQVTLSDTSATQATSPVKKSSSM